MKTKNKTYNLIPLSKALEKKLKSKKFRKEFDEELSRLKLAHELKLLRQKKRLTQRQVAIKAEMPQSVIARIESGNHSFSLATLTRVARVFRKDVGLVEHAPYRL